MKAPKFLVDQLSQKQPILIVDRKGVIGIRLAEVLKDEFLPVFVSSKKPDSSLLDYVVYIPFHKKPPKIPENTFPYVYYIDDESRVSRGLLPSLVSYVEKHNGILSLVTSIYQKPLKKREALLTNPRVFQFLLGDVFGYEYTKTSVIGAMLLSAKHKQHLTLPNHGLDDLYPISVDEVVGNILKTIYSPTEQTNRVVLLYPRHPVTGLSLSRTLLAMNPEITIDFVKKQNHFPTPLWFPDSGMFAQLTPLDEQVRNSFSDLPQEEGSVTLTRKRTTIPYLPQVFLVGLSLFLIFALPFLLLIGFGFAGAFLTQRSIDSLESQEFQVARVNAEQAKHSFAISGSVADALTPASTIVGQGITLASFKKKIQTAYDVNDLLIDVSYALEMYKTSQEARDPDEARSLVVSAIQRLKQVLLGLSIIEAEGRMPSEYEKRLAPYKHIGEYFLATSDVLPSILGYEGKRRYLLLFQNNNELRPGGGFIGSYGILDINQGKLENISIHDVYDADGQLSSHVEPPFPLKEYMGVSHWYLRDSNFAIDYPENAARAAFFLKLETGEVVDGVIGIDTLFIANLLKATGPIAMIDYDQTITSENFSTVTQHEIEDEFFPGSQKKKQFLTTFYDQLSERIIAKGDLSIPILLESVASSLAEKHLLFTFANESEQIPFTVSNLSGSLWDKRTTSSVDPYFFDTLGLYEANVGENKVNPFIERYITHDVLLDEEGVSTTAVTVSYKNTSSDASPFGGIYKNYVRFVTPDESTVTSLVIDGQEKVLLDSVQSVETRSDRGPVSRNSVSVDRGVEEGNKTFGFLLEVPPGATTEMTITYETQTDFTNGDPEYLYDLRLLKQPGRDADPYSLSITYPDSYQVVTSSRALSPKGNSLSTFFLLKEDVSFSLLLGEK